MLAALGRSIYRPAHLHFMVSAPGFDTIITHIFTPDCPYLKKDPVFGVKESLIADFRKIDDPAEAAKLGLQGPVLVGELGLRDGAEGGCLTIRTLAEAWRTARSLRPADAAGDNRITRARRGALLCSRTWPRSRLFCATALRRADSVILINGGRRHRCGTTHPTTRS